MSLNTNFVNVTPRKEPKSKVIPHSYSSPPMARSNSSNISGNTPSSSKNKRVMKSPNSSTFQLNSSVNIPAITFVDQSINKQKDSTKVTSNNPLISNGRISTVQDTNINQILNSMTTVKDELKAKKNDDILQERLMEAKSNFNTGAVVHKFSLWKGVKKSDDIKSIKVEEDIQIQISRRPSQSVNKASQENSSVVVLNDGSETSKEISVPTVAGNPNSLNSDTTQIPSQSVSEASSVVRNQEAVSKTKPRGPKAAIQIQNQYEQVDNNYRNILSISKGNTSSNSSNEHISGPKKEAIASSSSSSRSSLSSSLRNKIDSASKLSRENSSNSSTSSTKSSNTGFNDNSNGSVNNTPNSNKTSVSNLSNVKLKQTTSPSIIRSNITSAINNSNESVMDVNGSAANDVIRRKNSIGNKNDFLQSNLDDISDNLSSEIDDKNSLHANENLMLLNISLNSDEEVYEPPLHHKVSSVPLNNEFKIDDVSRKQLPGIRPAMNGVNLPDNLYLSSQTYTASVSSNNPIISGPNVSKVRPRRRTSSFIDDEKLVMPIMSLSISNPIPQLSSTIPSKHLSLSSESSVFSPRTHKNFDNITTTTPPLITKSKIVDKYNSSQNHDYLHSQSHSNSRNHSAASSPTSNVLESIYSSSFGNTLNQNSFQQSMPPYTGYSTPTVCGSPLVNNPAFNNSKSNQNQTVSAELSLDFIPINVPNDPKPLSKSKIKNKPEFGSMDSINLKDANVSMLSSSLEDSFNDEGIMYTNDKFNKSSDSLSIMHSMVRGSIDSTDDQSNEYSMRYDDDDTEIDILIQTYDMNDDTSVGVTSNSDTNAADGLIPLPDSNKPMKSIPNEISPISLNSDSTSINTVLNDNNATSSNQPKPMNIADKSSNSDNISSTIKVVDNDSTEVTSEAQNNTRSSIPNFTTIDDVKPTNSTEGDDGNVSPTLSIVTHMSDIDNDDKYQHMLHYNPNDDAMDANIDLNDDMNSFKPIQANATGNNSSEIFANMRQQNQDRSDLPILQKLNNNLNDNPDNAIFNNHHVNTQRNNRSLNSSYTEDVENGYSEVVYVGVDGENILRWKKGQHIGEGTFGRVYKGTVIVCMML